MSLSGGFSIIDDNVRKVERETKNLEKEYTRYYTLKALF